ncbi:synaptic vesicle membrane protein VAT-1 homolog [Hydra vulgaris]|uniref:synaptic vesicle membrane protein VAT-1 homolog n=1 Tax=Hydra vulgaris TaxID=6087 RepID=UPI000640CE42|nr:synaptic vesicle membrane protein VAT-1 homolog [Hydra vulgaris]
MIRIPSAGGYEKLVYTTLPECGYTKGVNIEQQEISDSDCVVVETYACGVNYADIIIRWGLYKSATDFVGWPITPGFEFSGTIKSVGQNVKDFVVGDKVAGLTCFGAYTTCIKAPSYMIRKVPLNISMSTAAGFLTVAATAYYAAFELCKLRVTDSVLVHSAAGGVGSMLCQMLRNAGCNVVGVVGATHKVEAAKNLGCLSVIDKSVHNLWEEANKIAPNGYAAIFDANGVETLKDSYNHVKPGGRLISYGSATLFPRSTKTSNGELSTYNWLKLVWNYKNRTVFDPMEMTSSNKSVMAFNLSFMFGEKELIKECLDILFKWISEGSIKLDNITEYSLRDVANAHRDLESGNSVGKIVLLTRDENYKNVE